MANEHYGLAGLVVVLVAGIALSVTIDVAIILSKGAEPSALLVRLVLDAVFLSVRLAIVSAILALLTAGISRVVRRPIELDQAFTALAFATAPLVLSPLVVALMLVAFELPEPWRGAMLVAALGVGLGLVARLVASVLLNLTGLVGRWMVLVGGVALLAGALILQDQIGRVAFTALAYAPHVLPPPAAVPAEGAEVRLQTGLRLAIPPGWREASRGVPGVVGQYELPDARLTVRLKDVSMLTTTDAFGAAETQTLRRDFTDIDRSTHAFVRIDDAPATDDRWSGRIDDVRLVQRVYAVVAGTSGHVIEFRFFSPADEEGALDSAARIAATIRLPD